MFLLVNPLTIIATPQKRSGDVVARCQRSGSVGAGLLEADFWPAPLRSSPRIRSRHMTP